MKILIDELFNAGTILEKLQNDMPYLSWQAGVPNFNKYRAGLEELIYFIYGDTCYSLEPSAYKFNELKNYNLRESSKNSGSTGSSYTYYSDMVYGIQEMIKRDYGDDVFITSDEPLGDEPLKIVL